MLHVILRRGGAIATIDPTPTAGTLTARQAVCAAPRGIAYRRTATDPRGLRGRRARVAARGGRGSDADADARSRSARRGRRRERDLAGEHISEGGGARRRRLRGLSRRGCTRGRGRADDHGLPQMRTPSVAWRMVALDQTAGSVVMLHQTGVTDMIDPAAGGYAGLKGCGGIVQPGVSVLDPGKANPGVVGSLGNLSLAVDVAVSPIVRRSRWPSPATARTGPSVVEQPLQTVTASPPPSCGTMGTGVTTTQPPGQVVAVAYSGRACCSRRRASPPRSGARTPARRRPWRRTRAPIPATTSFTSTRAAGSPAPRATRRVERTGASGTSSARGRAGRSRSAAGSATRRRSTGTEASSTSRA